MTTTRTLRTAATVLGLSLALAGCGGTAAPDETAQGATRTVTDSTGAEVTVPQDPQRVVTLHYAATQPMVDLGIMPVGQGSFEPGIIPEEIAGELEAIPVVATTEVDVEAVAEQEPDLILAPNVTEDDVRSQLEQIAPVYTFTLRGGDRARWEQRVEEVADALNVAERTAGLREDFEARQAAIAEEYADVVQGRTVAVISAYEENNFYAWGEENMSGTLLIPLGFTWSADENAAVQGQDTPEATLSSEQLAATVGDADVLFYDTNLREEPNAFMQSVQGSPLYAELPAVQQDRAYPFGKATVAGYTDAGYSLDRIEAALEDMRS